MDNVEIYVAKASDKFYFDVGDRVAADLQTEIRTFTLGNQGFERDKMSPQDNEKFKAALEADLPLFATTTIHFASHNAQFTVFRTHDRSSDYLDKVQVSFGSATPMQAAEISVAIRKHLGERTITDIGNAFTPELQRHYELREAALARLETLTATFAKNLERERQQREKEFTARLTALSEEERSRRAELARELDEKRKQFEDEQKDYVANLQSRSGDLDALEEGLAEREKQFSRKAIYAEMLKKFAENQTQFKLSDGTTKQREPVNKFVLGVLVVAAISLGICFIQALRLDGTEADTFVWFLAGRFAVSGLALGTTVIYYAKWLANWFQRLANEEFRNRRMELDLHRANWFAELAFQWKERNNEIIPKDLIDSLTRDLFIGMPDEQAPRHPAELLDGGLQKIELTPKGAIIHTASMKTKKPRT